MAPLSGALSLELSFVPLFDPKVLVGPGRLELPTSRLSGVRSNQLSYGPMAARRPFDQSHPWARDHIARPEACLASPIGDEWKEKRRRRNSAPVVFLDD
jgi:hypothetical protein